MSSCVFLLNDAGEGGAAVYISNGIQYMLGNITHCYFANAIAWSTFLPFFFFSFNKFIYFIVGGAISTNFNHPNGQIMISYSYFQNNSADMGACLVTNNPTGTVYVKNNVFLENRGVTEWKVLIGSGSVLRSGESRDSIVDFSQNLVAFNEVEFKGLILI